MQSIKETIKAIAGTMFFVVLIVIIPGEGERDAFTFGLIIFLLLSNAQDINKLKNYHG